MSDLKYIPAKPGQRLPAGAYWVIDRSGVEAIIRRDESFALGHATHYSPIEKPVAPEPEPEPQDCPFCGEGTRFLQTFGEWEVVCVGCDFDGPSRHEKATAITAWNRITLKEVQP